MFPIGNILRAFGRCKAPCSRSGTCSKRIPLQDAAIVGIDEPAGIPPAQRIPYSVKHWRMYSQRCEPEKCMASPLAGAMNWQISSTPPGDSQP